MRTENIYYNSGVITQTYDLDKSKYWFDFVYSYKNNKGKIWAIIVNAWDAGLFFTYVDTSKSKNILKEKAKHHITNSLHSYSYVFHVGKYNKNNLSPGRSDAWITLIKKNAYTKIYIKLWRKMPDDIYDPADLVFILEVKTY